MDVATFVSSIFNDQLPFRVEAYDGSSARPSVVSSANDITLKILNRDALMRVLTRPGELGLARAYVAGDIDIDGDLDALFELRVPPTAATPRPWPTFARSLRRGGRLRSGLLAPPSIEARQRGALHSRARDRERHLAPLRRLESLLRDGARPVDDVLVRGLSSLPTTRSSRRPTTQGRPRGAQARPASRACACSTSVAAGGPWASTRRENTAPRSSASPSPKSSSATPPNRPASLASPTWSSFACRTFAT